MAAKPPISVRRPTRPMGEPLRTAPVPISHAPMPNIDTDAPEAVAFAMRGRISSSSSGLEGEGASRLNDPSQTVSPLGSSSNLPPEPQSEMGLGPRPTARPVDNADQSDSEGSPDDIPLISVKLPPEIGRRLAAVADRRGSKRTLVAIEVLSEPLRRLAAEH